MYLVQRSSLLPPACLYCPANALASYHERGHPIALSWHFRCLYFFISASCQVAIFLLGHLVFIFHDALETDGVDQSLSMLATQLLPQKLPQKLVVVLCILFLSYQLMYHMHRCKCYQLSNYHLTDFINLIR